MNLLETQRTSLAFNLNYHCYEAAVCDIYALFISEPNAYIAQLPSTQHTASDAQLQNIYV